MTAPHHLGDMNLPASREANGAVRAVVALGSNMGDRDDHIAAGAAALDRMGSVLEISHVYETEPVGSVPQRSFLNAVISFSTALAPADLLLRLLETEKVSGRVRDIPGGPRTLDLDLLFYGDRIIRRPGLTVPHPRWKARAFVCIPLLEILPSLVDPESGLTVEEWCRGWVSPAAHVERHAPLDWARS